MGTTQSGKCGVKEIAKLFPPLAINEFMQSCRVDDARSAFATKCLYRMGI
jgi:hypothetical protein